MFCGPFVCRCARRRSRREREALLNRAAAQPLHTDTRSGVNQLDLHANVVACNITLLAGNGCLHSKKKTPLVSKNVHARFFSCFNSVCLVLKHIFCSYKHRIVWDVEKVIFGASNKIQLSSKHNMTISNITSLVRDECNLQTTLSSH